MHNTQSFAPALPFSFLFWQNTQFAMSSASPPHCSPFQCYHVFAFPFCSTSLLAFHGHLHSLSCLPSLLVCYTFLFTKRGKAEITVGLGISLTDALILWTYSTFFNICSFPSPTHCSTPHPLNSHIHWRFSLCIHTLVLHPFLFGIQLHVFKYVPNQRQETCKLKKPLYSHLIT